MENTNEGMTAETQKPSLPRRIIGGIKSGISNALGQLASREFWLDLGARVVKEMINAFMKTLGAKFLNFGVSREDQDIKRSAQAATQSGGNAAFSNNYYTGAPKYPETARSDYASRYTPQVPAIRPDTKFPGF
jgi:hypothetical protein